MKDYSKKNRVLVKYNIVTLKDIQVVKHKQEKILKKHLNESNKLYYKKKNLNIDQNKDEVYKGIIPVTE